MKQHKSICRWGAALVSAVLTVSLLATGVSAKETVTAAQVRETANAAAEYLVEHVSSTGYSAGDLATVQLLYRSGLEQAQTTVENYLTLAEKELETYGAAVYQGYDDNYDPIALPSLVGTLGAAWLAEETGDAALSARLEEAAETLGTAELIASDNPYNIARSLWCAEELGCSQTLKDALATGLMSYYNQDQQAFDYWGCSVDTNTVMAKGALRYTGEVSGVAQAAENAMTFVDSLRQEDGSYYSDFQWSTDSNADSTGLALSAMADWAAEGRYSQEEMAQTYRALMDRYFIAESGAFGYMDRTTANLMATADALEGLLTYGDVLEQQELPVVPEKPGQETPGTPSTPEEETPSAPVEETPSAPETGSPSVEESTTSTAAGESSPETGDNGAFWAGGALALLILSAAGGVIGMKKVRK